MNTSSHSEIMTAVYRIARSAYGRGVEQAPEPTIDEIRASLTVPPSVGGDGEVSDAELDAAAEALGWPGDPTARATALVALTAAARVRAARGEA
jgi:hypothetical protein